MNPLKLLYLIEARVEIHDERLDDLELIVNQNSQDLSLVTSITRSLFGTQLRRRITAITVVAVLALIDIVIDFIGIEQAIRSALGIQS
jgi:hypothetical protein